MIELIECNESTILITVQIDGAAYSLCCDATGYELQSQACERWSGYRIYGLDLALRMYEDWTQEARNGR